MERCLVLRVPCSGVTEGECGGIPRDALVALDQGKFEEASRAAQEACGCSSLAKLFVAVCLLDRFLELNWTGPVALPITEASKDDLSALEIDGETPMAVVVRDPSLLVRARRLCSECCADPTLATAPWWSARIALVHQRVMSDRCASLKAVVDSGFDDAVRRFGRSLPGDDGFDEALASCSTIERALAHLHYREPLLAREAIARACRAVGISFELAGALGRRTKYQEKYVSQLMLTVIKQRRSPDPKTFPGLRLPEPTRLEADSDLLEYVEFQAGIDPGLLTPIEQSLLLVMAADKQTRGPQGVIRTEEALAYVTRVLRDPTDWSVHCSAMLARSRLEASGTKTAHRALTQIESLVALFSSTSEECKAGARVAMHHLVALPSLWELKRELGHSYAAFGSAESALRVFEEVQMWDEVVLCLAASGQKAKAEALARGRLEKCESPELLCVLGDVTGEREHYERAWKVSKGTFARAKRSLGNWCFGKQKFEEAMTHYSEALAINPLFERCWFALGCCAMQQAKWDDALRAFSRVVSIDPEDGESWCNIAAVHMQAGRAQEAHVSLHEALKQKPDSWKIWQNYLLVSVAPQVRDYRAGIFAVGKLLDLMHPSSSSSSSSSSDAPRQIDPRPMFALVTAVVENAPTKAGDGAAVLKEQLAKLLCRVERDSEMSPPLWDIFAVFAEETGDAKNALERRSGQCRSLEGSWPGDTKRWALVSDAYMSLARVAIAVGDKSCLPKLRTVLDRASQHHKATKEFSILVSMVAKLEQMK